MIPDPPAMRAEIGKCVKKQINQRTDPLRAVFIRWSSGFYVLGRNAGGLVLALLVLVVLRKIGKRY